MDDLLPDSWQRIASLGPRQSLELSPDWSTIHGDFGRGVQLNRAARAAQGDWLWFVHADSAPDPRTISAVQALVSDKGLTGNTSVLAYGRLAFDADGPSATRLNALGANWRSRWLRLPYGDQGLCLRRSDFLALGGFCTDLDRGEDLDFIVRARAAGLTFIQLAGCVQTSARRYRDRGWLRTSVEHQIAALRLIRNAKRALRD
jgi:hypothetical protein